MFLVCILDTADISPEIEVDFVAPRANTISHEPARRLHIAGELLRGAMMSLCGIPPEDVSYTPLGKPYTPSRPDVAYSISHSGTLAACALLTLDGDHIIEQPLSVGVDIQRADGSGSAKDDASIMRFANRFYSDAEIAEISAVGDKKSAFYRIWTMKEALLKYTGEGLSRPLKSADTKSESFGVRYVTHDVFDSSGMKYALAVCFPAYVNEYPSLYRITPNDSKFYRAQDVKDAIIALNTGN
ncbi:MAG TPA: 4'-phosphopantetheinyl transferase superfamily protein [Bacillota bacterium]|nr:4'-phosphopantetheinyl transferase superfamily protein [Bacillota bacterium]